MNTIYMLTEEEKEEVKKINQTKFNIINELTHVLGNIKQDEDKWWEGQRKKHKISSKTRLSINSNKEGTFITEVPKEEEVKKEK